MPPSFWPAHLPWGYDGSLLTSFSVTYPPPIHCPRCNQVEQSKKQISGHSQHKFLQAFPWPMRLWANSSTQHFRPLVIWHSPPFQPCLTSLPLPHAQLLMVFLVSHQVPTASAAVYPWPARKQALPSVLQGFSQMRLPP